MSKIIGLILLLLVFSCTKPPQDNLSLIIKYKPESKYNYTSEQTLQTIIKYSGKAKILLQLKSRGIYNPTIINKKSTTQALIKTGRLEDDNSFPIKVEYVSSIINNGVKEVPLKATIHGKGYNEKPPLFDLAIAKDLDKKSSKVLLESWQKSFSQLSFSGEKLKIGETLTTQNPISIPMEGSEIEMIVTTNYKLISIKDGIANFDILQQYALNPKLMDNSFHGTVVGKGHLVYDISNSIVLNYTLKTEMKLYKKLDSFEFELNTNSEFVQTTKIAND